MKKSAGILVFRHQPQLQVFLVHPGGPFYKKKDEGVWTIPKGEIEEGEDYLQAAKREFLEETGITLNGDFISLQPVKQKSGKLVFSWALETNVDADKIVSNIFDLEWPPRSGKFEQFPEIDRAEWFTVENAKKKIFPAQIPLLEELAVILGNKRIKKDH